MQIRAANRQDEGVIRTIISQTLEELGLSYSLETKDNDLRNIEKNYFWHDGLCIVSEDEGQIVGVLAARSCQNDENILVLNRLAVLSPYRKKGIAKRLLDTMLFFAKNLEYKKVELGHIGPSADLLKIDAKVLAKLGFQKIADGSKELKHMFVG